MRREMPATAGLNHVAIIDLGGGAALNAFEVDGSTIIDDLTTLEAMRGLMSHGLT